MIEFGGWEMPVAYLDITTEHHQVRTAAGLFDLCHMGRVAVSGQDATELLQRVQSNDVEKIGVNRIRYAMLLQDDGGVIDDILVHRRENDFFIVVNASNRERDVDRICQLGDGLDATVEDQSDSLAMLAVQGPKSAEAVARLTDDIDVAAVPYYGLAEGHLLDSKAMVTRTGYTGEDGFELYVATEEVVSLWDGILERCGDLGVTPCGLGARDTLRLEAGMPLYGHEITEEINPVEAGLMFGIRLKKPDYPGRDALARIKAEGPARRLVGLTVEGRRIPRQGYPVLINGENSGIIASGSWSPTFDRAIATALVSTAALEGDSVIEVDIRGRKAAAQTVELPFYKKDGSGSLNEKSQGGESA